MSTADSTATQASVQTAQVPHSEFARRIPELDGLRGLAILLVVICHYVGDADHAGLGYWPHHFLSALSVGWSGVDLFFVLSGFLIGGILLDSRNSSQYFKTFYVRRIHRILPIYYAWIAIYVLIVGANIYLARGRSAVTGQELRVVPVYFFFLQNMIYSPSPFQWKWFAVTWSLAVEEQFYLLAPPAPSFSIDPAPRVRLGGDGLRGAGLAVPCLPIFSAVVLSAAICDALPGGRFRAGNPCGRRVALESISRLSRHTSRGITAVRRLFACRSRGVDVVVHASARAGDIYDRL
jgi:peptidoglycan/LPS O-acetylase OafA/YrhL